MGTTFSSIHVYSANAVSGYSDFYSFSEGWQTYMPKEEPADPFDFKKLAKKISRTIDAAVLWFYVFDDETLIFEFYKNGKKAASYFQMEPSACKNLYGIPALVGYESGNKRRLSKILSCSDLDYQIELLEEYFGVCLLPLREILEESPDSLRRIRDDKLYQEYYAEEEKISGKHAPIKLTQVSEQRGKLFWHRAGERGISLQKLQHCYYFGFDSPDSVYERGALRPVRFEHGNLSLISQEEFDAVPMIPIGHLCSELLNNGVLTFEGYNVHFTDKAPGAFKNKTIVVPRGYTFGWFDDKDRAILTDMRSGIAIVDGSLKVIAKMHVKGMPIDYADGHILSVGSESFWMYSYNPSNAVRIYRIDEK